VPAVEWAVADTGVATVVVLPVAAGIVRVRAAVVAPTLTTRAASDQFDSRLTR
jgi:hypothetical protein